MHDRKTTMLKPVQCLFVLALAALAWVCLLPSPARTQTTAAEKQEDTLASLIPADAVLYVERAGHTAVREAFLASNFGELAMDDAVYDFVQTSRVQTGKMIVRMMFDLTDEEEIAERQQTLHEMLKPFWYEPAGVFLIVRDGLPKPGFICRTGEYFAECQQAVDTLIAFDVPPIGTPGERQKFTFEYAGVLWEGVAKDYSPWVLPEDEQEKVRVLDGKQLFMVHWADDTVFVTLDLDAARAVSDVIASQGTDAAETVSKAGNEDLQAVMAKTAMDDWAFKWYVDVEAWLSLVGDESDAETSKVLSMLGVDAVVGVGGTGGYIDNVYARKTYIYAPEMLGGVWGLLKPDGSYAQALSMTPDTASIFLAGQVDTDAVVSLVRNILLMTAPSEGDALAPGLRPAVAGGDDADIAGDIQLTASIVEEGPTVAPQGLTGDAAEFMEAFEQLMGASGGNCTAYMGNPTGMMAAMIGGIPVGFVLDVTDHQQATEAAEKLMAMAHMPLGDGAEGGNVYRDIPIFGTTESYGPSPSVAIMDDRIVLAFSDNALKSAIDAAMDDTSGFPVNSRGDAMAALAGDGAAIFAMDLAALARTFWPMLMQMTTNEYMADNFPLVGLPSAGKLARMLGHEVAVFKPDDEGLLLDSRGQVPFATKVVPGYPLLMFMMMGGLYF